jgi:hypothetical protein
LDPLPVSDSYLSGCPHQLHQLYFPHSPYPHYHPLPTQTSVLALAAVRHTYTHSLLTSSDPGLASNYVLILTQVEMACSLSTGVLITLKPFTKALHTGFGMGGDAVRQYGSSKATSNSYTDDSKGKRKGSGPGSSLDSRIPDRLGLSSKGSGVAALVLHTINDQDQTEEVDMEDMTHTRSCRDMEQAREKSENVTELTTDDVILQTIDYQVEYEDVSQEGSEAGRIVEREGPEGRDHSY